MRRVKQRLQMALLTSSLTIILFIGWCVWPGDVDASMLDGWKPTQETDYEC